METAARADARSELQRPGAGLARGQGCVDTRRQRVDPWTPAPQTAPLGDPAGQSARGPLGAQEGGVRGAWFGSVGTGIPEQAGSEVWMVRAASGAGEPPWLDLGS